MKTTERFERAIKKLYTAFHEGTLDAADCQHCAVGNILGHASWYFHCPETMSTENDCFFLPIINNSGYCSAELINIERRFLLAWPYEKRKNGYGWGHEKDIQFKALCRVVEYLCELDGIPNVMDYAKLFKTEKGKPKYQLT